MGTRKQATKKQEDFEIRLACAARENNGWGKCVCVCVDRIVSGVVFNLLQIGLNCSGFRCSRNLVRPVHFEKVSHVSIAKITVIYTFL